MSLQPQQKAISVGLGRDHNHCTPTFESGPDELSEAIQKPCIVRIETHLVVVSNFYIPLKWSTSILGCERWGGYRIGTSDQIVPRKSCTNEALAPKYRAHSFQKFASGIRLVNVARSSRTQRFSHHIDGRFLAYKKHLGFWEELVDSPSGLHTIQGWKPDVEHNQIGLQLFGFPNGF
jgi:hypothetical protein